MLAARVEQKNGTYLNNIQRDRQSSASPTPVAVFGICPDRHSHRQHPLAYDLEFDDAECPFDAQHQLIVEIIQLGPFNSEVQRGDFWR